MEPKESHPELQGAQGQVLQTFPPEFRKRLFQDLDKRYFSILFATWLLFYSVAFYFAIHPPKETSVERLVNIQRNFASFLLSKELIASGEEAKQPPEKLERIVEQVITSSGEMMESAVAKLKEGTAEMAPRAEGPAGGPASATAETKLPSMEEFGEARAAGSEARRLAREALSRRVGSVGLLELLTGSGSAASGEVVEDFLGHVARHGEDMDQVISKLGALSSLKKGGNRIGGNGNETDLDVVRNLKGNRIRSAGVALEELVTELASSKTTLVSRNEAYEEVPSISALGNRERRNMTRNPEEVSEIVEAHNNAMQDCYKQELKRDPNLRGKVAVRFTVDVYGHVTAAEIVSSTLNNPNMEDCILRKVKRWMDFGECDPSIGDTTFRQVYVFGY